MKFFLLFIVAFLVYAHCCAEELSGWNIIVYKIESKNSFDLVKDVQIYSGDFLVEERHQKSKEGFCFVEAEIEVSKVKLNAPVFKISDIKLKVENHYFGRYQDDVFLKEFKKTIFPHLNLKQGKHRGSILFEIPQDFCDKSKILQYQTINFSME